MTADPEEIRRRIEDTRSELSADVNALTEKVNPSRVVARRVDRTRAALTNVKDKVVGTTENAASTVADTAGSAVSATTGRVSSMASSAADTVTAVPQAARRGTQGNALAAGLIAFGGGWLIASLIPTSHKEQELAGQAKDRLGEQLQPVAQQVQQAASDLAESLREPAHQAVESVKSTASDATSTVAEQSRAAASQVSERAGEAKQNVGKQTG